MTLLCPGCQQPMVDGQVFNGLLKCHWDCTDKTRAALGEAVAAQVEQNRVDARLRADGLTPDMASWKRLGGSV